MKTKNPALCSQPDHLSQLALAVSLALLSLQATAVTKTYTLDGEFDQGTLLNVNHNAPNSNQLQLNTIASTFPILWIANGGEDTLTKFDSANNKEIARYRTWFGPAGQPGHVSHLGNPFAGPAPSRTAVDTNGNAYVANRWFANVPPVVVKILTEGGIDRNGNGVIDTSSDLNNDGVINDAGEILNMADTNGNGIIDCPQSAPFTGCEIQDERIAWAVRVGPNNGLGRSMCIGTDGHLWVGMYNVGQYFKISSVDGHTIAGPISTTPTAGQPNAGGGSPYGCLVDGNGTLWGANLSGILTKITNTQNYTAANNTPALAGSVVASFNSGVQNYGIALGKDALGNPAIFLGSIGGGRYHQFNPATNAFSALGQGSNFASAGIGVDGSDKIVTGPYLSGGVTKYNPDGTIVWAAPTQLSSETRGVIPDQDGNIWQVSRTGSRLMKYRGTDGAPLGTFEVGNHPYTYSDVNGITNLNVTNPTGTWDAIFDSGAAGTPWGTVNWNDQVPTGAGVEVLVRVADVQGNLALQPYVPVSKNTAFSATGRFIQVQAKLTANQQEQSPILFDLTLNSVAQAICDVDLDGDIDKVDLSLISKARGQAAQPGDPRDANLDGLISPADVKVCTPKCTRPNCATTTTAP
ncbi:MAG: hypothetical protein IV101_08475 [Dechloromonas sp.]|uniref:hypothetical protein n=1 Tax=Dechloromonas sp. TaxID=1917218 RepID=UPI0027F82579|nr:hypothetical protein [Dechloromonas sp.]MBT9520918.1 hypothetical protein [Dechloromonas sp.]